jgi:hypothetical protein
LWWKIALLARAFLGGNLGSDLGEEAVQSLGGSDGALQGAALTERRNIFRGILETNTIGGAVRAQELYRGSCQISFKAGNINFLVGSGRHRLLLNFFGG